MARVRLKDVAAACGVSPATVSLVLNEASDRIPATTIARVRAAADELGYTPNTVARSLRTRRTHTIGAVTDTLITTASSAPMVQGALDVAWRHDHLVLWLGTEDQPDHLRQAVASLVARQVDGFLVGAMYHRRLPFASLTQGIPTVGLNAVSDDPAAPCFVPDDFGAARAAVRLLLDHGHRRIAHISEPVGDGLARQLRVDGFRAALTEAGLGEGRVLVPPHWHEGSGFAEELALRALDAPDRPTAIFAFNDIAATGVYHAARRLGLSIPGDLSVVGFDDYVNVASELYPKLTTMALPHRRMGQLATEALLARLGVLDGEAPEGVTRVACPPVVRDSIAPPPRDR
ncbi:LacI family DNA-binding transcriptional regulator [Propioniciclava soli]|uniref:LacI family DNA-binding transcriptional regulator n=1 Tax=Propioniciclava soli TaxID=2775081 RepID=UPI001E3BBC21